ncbi:hypothetical protein U0070_006210 [Myodes glareolus]|uniref:Uncharacterized protein n=1 Tax=Myodes glareolus TaxID=447135 RepID=A0AAW0HLN9_MYOGA
MPWYPHIHYLWGSRFLGTAYGKCSIKEEMVQEERVSCGGAAVSHETQEDAPRALDGYSSPTMGFSPVHVEGAPSPAFPPDVPVLQVSAHGLFQVTGSNKKNPDHPAHYRSILLVMALGDRNFGEVIRLWAGSLMNGNSALKKNLRDPTRLLGPCVGIQLLTTDMKPLSHQWSLWSQPVCLLPLNVEWATVKKPSEVGPLEEQSFPSPSPPSDRSLTSIYSAVHRIQPPDSAARPGTLTPLATWRCHPGDRAGTHSH